MRNLVQSTSTKRAALYLRVSSEEQVQGYSLPAQERAAEAHCRQQGWEIVQTYRDEGISARTNDERKRPAFAAMMAAAEARHFDVIIVHKLDRFARNRRVAFDALHRLGTSGVGFVSLSENMDYSTPAGQLMLTMLVGMAQFYSDNLSFETKKGKGERKAQGVYNGLLPYGVTKNEIGIPVLDSDAKYCDLATRGEIVPSAGLMLAFELAAAGRTDREIARALNDAGYRTSGNRGTNPFTKDSVRVILRNRFYVGDLPDGEGGWVPGKHGEIIDPALFDTANKARDTNARKPRRVAGIRSPWALSGVAICGACGSPIVATGNGTARRRIECAGRKQGHSCTEPSCYADVIEDQINAALGSFRIPEHDRGRLLALWNQYSAGPTAYAVTRRKLEGKLERLRLLYLDGDIDRPDYQRQRADIQADVAALPDEQETGEVVGCRLASFLADVSEAWTAARPDERNQIARELFTRVIVLNRTAVAVTPKPQLRPFFLSIAVNDPGIVGYGGSDGLWSSGNPLPSDSIVIRTPPVAQRYQAKRVRKVSEADRENIVATVLTGKSLREVAAEHGVSHEFVRQIARSTVSSRTPVRR